ncbi:hypothetical protein FGG08_002229 [Glutinoglossum americanum]|uniref:Uncharacterized protein n=1 Tax=Glutinoglossum americanum TaxID=1670608 RepID=A0A9P8IA27_9PEZI|nr:hypothetical protein FGG08_002229 [Glutinoglossum americanum]
MLSGRRVATVLLAALTVYCITYVPYPYRTGGFKSPTNANGSLSSGSPWLSSPTSPSPSDKGDHVEPVDFTHRQSWRFDVDPFKKFNPKGPKPENIIILTATDGNGNNAEIPDLLENVGHNRQEYCDYHGYICVFTNITKYDLEDKHPVWAKIPGIAQAFHEHPDSEWLWWLDMDAIIMTPSIDLSSHILSHTAIASSIKKNEPIKLGSEKAVSNVTTAANPLPADIDILVAQDQNGINAGSFMIRRSLFSRFLLDMWTEPLFMSLDAPGREQDALMNFFLEHPIVREHTGLVEMRMFNAYSVGPPGYGWRDGDLAVHFAGCWVDHHCMEAFQEHWKKRGEVRNLPHGEEKLRKANQYRGWSLPTYS